MDRSPYLAQALQGMGHAPPQAQPGPGLADLAAALMQRPGQRGQPGMMAQPRQSIGQSLRAAGQNLMGVPGRLGAIPGNLAAVPGNVMSNVQQLPGLLGLGRSGIR